MFEFLKKRKEKQSKYQVDSENLAVPEVHIGEISAEHENEEDSTHDDSDSPITVDTEDVAIPEIHIHKNNKRI